ncbi:hypothetical protein [Jannaschia pohangensis]|uniref:Uncharacterized protein n=1 Tax=Jannaschia pohangensis TaxID=390807 RepID=A0A1I3JJR4_9RHOB|nr:hypothetical protein [Jannaschia pohangensis]SFI60519.1 hypothetical protein SAMN04488095_1345 [Jannaschia pohangensis]
MKAGFEIFIAALRSLVERPVPAIGLLVLFWAVDFALTQMLLLPAIEDAPLSIAPFVASIVLVGLVASTWHRIVLLPEGPPISTWRALHYAVAWFVLGIVITIALIPAFLLLAGFGFLMRHGLVLATDGPPWGDILAAGAFLHLNFFQITVFFSVALVVIGLPFTWLLCRIGLGLPNLAIGRGDLSFRGSWARTAPLARPIAWLAVIVGLTQVLLLLAPFLFMPSLEDTEAFYAATDDLEALPPGYLFSDVIGTVGYGLVVMLGAAILTELYRRTEPTP